jgi:hypothetical protein
LPPREPIDQAQQDRQAKMAFFKVSLEKQLSNAVSARDKLRTRLAEAEAAIIERQAAAEQAALDGADDNALTGAENKLRAAQDRGVTLRAALTKSEALVARLEHERAKQADAAQREKTGSEVELLARAVIEAAGELTAAAATMADLAARAAVAVPEARGLEQFVGACRVEVPAAADLIARLLRTHAAAVLARTAPAVLAKPPEPIVEPLKEKPPTVTLFALRPVRWIAADGAPCIAQKFTDAELTPSAASRGLACGALVPLDSPLRRQNHGTVEGHPRADLAFDLDAAPVRTAEPTLHSAFEPARIGEPRILKIAREG